MIVSCCAAAGSPIEVAKGHQPQATVDAQGNVVLVFADDLNTILLSRSEDGRSFSTPMPMNTPRGKLSLGLRRGPRIVATPDALVVTYIAGESGGGKDENLFSVRSIDGGKTWSEPARINSSDRSAREGLHAMCADAAGHVLCVWLDQRDGRMEVYGSRSPDSGRNWGEDFLIYRAPKGSICECCSPTVVASPTGGALVMFRNNVDGNRDMYVVRSADMVHFGEAVKLGEQSWKLSGCPMDGGALASTADATYAIHRRQADLYLVRMDPPQEEKSFAPGANPTMLPGHDGPVIAYLSRPARGDLMLANAGKTTKIAEQAQDPVLVQGKSGPLLLWESNGRVFSAVLNDADPR